MTFLLNIEPAKPAAVAEVYTQQSPRREVVEQPTIVTGKN